jgi:Janus/Ocnus family (Ocnus)
MTSEGQRLVTIFGFSYAFGRGDHAKAATIIKEWSNGEIAVFVDNSSSLY